MKRHDPGLLFLIAQYEMLGMIGLGKLPDPTGAAPSRDLGRARQAIDLLEMLERKTRGNLTAVEEGELRRVLTLLRLNFVAEASAASGGGDRDG